MGWNSVYRRLLMEWKFDALPVDATLVPVYNCRLFGLIGVPFGRAGVHVDSVTSSSTTRVESACFAPPRPAAVHVDSLMSSSKTNEES